MIKSMNNTKTIAAPDTPVLHIKSYLLFVFSQYHMVFSNLCAGFPIKILFFLSFFVMILNV